MGNFQLQDDFKVPYLINEVDADNNVVAAATGDSVTISSSDTDMATIVPDTVVAPGSVASGFIVGGKKLGTVTITAVVTHSDSTTLGPVTDDIDIVAGAGKSAGISLGTAVPQNLAPPPPPQGV